MLWFRTPLQHRPHPSLRTISFIRPRKGTDFRGTQRFLLLLVLRSRSQLISGYTVCCLRARICFLHAAVCFLHAQQHVLAPLGVSDMSTRMFHACPAVGGLHSQLGGFLSAKPRVARVPSSECPACPAVFACMPNRMGPVSMPRTVWPAYPVRVPCMSRRVFPAA